MSPAAIAFTVVMNVLVWGSGAVVLYERVTGRELFPTGPAGDHSTDGLGCPKCGHTPDEAGLRPYHYSRRRWSARCWTQVDASGWGDYCGCAHAFHGS